MAIAHAILAALLHKPCSGYDLAKRFDQSVESSVGFFWSASFQQIYRELGRLEEKGWLQAETVQQDNRPDKRIYSVTEAGQQALRQWIAEPDDPMPMKDDLLVKLYAGHLMPTEAMIRKLETQRHQHQQRLAIYQEIQQTHFQNPQALPEPSKYVYLTLLNGLHYEQGWLAWCEAAIAFLQS
jgi:DNA-binding PadR family transcriptional regulator